MQVGLIERDEGGGSREKNNQNLKNNTHVSVIWSALEPNEP